MRATKPSAGEVVGALSSSSYPTRNAARGYLELNRSWESFGQLFQSCTNQEETVWTAVGILEIMVQTEWTTEALSVKKLQEVLNSPPSAALPPAMKVLATVELARVTKDTDQLSAVAELVLTESEVAGVKPDLTRELRYSGPVRTRLAELNPKWAGFSRLEIQALGQTDIFSLR